MRLARTALVLTGLILATGPAMAEVARVNSGEHPDFTRIVVAAADPGAWRFGRTADGYELALGPAVTGFDLERVFDKIPKDRLSALWRDPASGRLRLSLSCACHAIAFEFRPDTVVIDVKPGAPPTGSAFEEPLDPAPAAAPGYDWLAVRDETRAAPAPALAAPLDVGAPDAGPVKAALLEQISRGVAEGVVDVAEAPDLGAAGSGLAETPGLRIAVGELPGVRARGPRDAPENLTAEGRACLPDSAFAITTWISAGPVADQIGRARTDLLGEFDTPRSEAVKAGARLYLALGFGAEARQILDFLTLPDEEADLLRSLGWLVDLEPAPVGPLAGQEVCDTAAAMWATLALATGGDSPARKINAGAVARTFSALPVHLRRHLGPPLIQLFLDRGDPETARILRDAILRTPVPSDAATALMDAGYRLATGDAEGAVEGASAALAAGGAEGAAAAVTLVEAAFADGKKVPPDLPGTVAAFLIEARGSPQEAALARAMVLAQAMTGQFADAFATLPQSPATARDLWSLAADSAGDDDLLRQALARPLPDVSPETALTVASRLQALGFADAALAWLGRGGLAEGASAGGASVGGARPDGARLVAARAHLHLRDARAVIAVLDGDRSPAAEAIRAAALLQLGDAAAAASAFARADLTAEADSARRRSADWPLVAEIGAEPWKTAALHALPSPPAEGPGPLARATSLADEAAATTAAVEALTAAVAAAR